MRKISSKTISRWWNLWFEQGIITKEGRKYNKTVSLRELGIEIESLTKEKDKKNDK